jgi:two-component system sensor histidine kinase KdpD
MYFVVALINAVLTFKIRGFEKKSRDREERENTIRLYNTLLNSLSHELRTPIATIIGAVDTIKENESKLSERNKRVLFNEIEIASFRLNRQVENLLNMSRLEAGALKPRPDWCDINELIYSVIKSNEEAAAHHQIVFESGEMPLFKIDRGILEQVLQNIIHNALLYTPPHSLINIRAFQNDGNCIVVISDTGPGVPEKEIEAVFEKFYRLPAGITGGTGLGLSIAKGFMESLKGSIKLENNKEGGAEFTLTIPAEK